MLSAVRTLTGKGVSVTVTNGIEVGIGVLGAGVLMGAGLAAGAWVGVGCGPQADSVKAISMNRSVCVLIMISLRRAGKQENDHL
jgi:hypothetical protein